MVVQVGRLRYRVLAGNLTRLDEINTMRPSPISLFRHELSINVVCRKRRIDAGDPITFKPSWFKSQTKMTV